MFIKRTTILSILVALCCVKAIAQNDIQQPPNTATVETWHTEGGTFYIYSSFYGWMDYTSDMETVIVAIDGNDIYIQGLAYWVHEGWIKGTISGNTATFANNQLAGLYNDEEPEYISGSTDGVTLAENIIFNYDAQAGTLEEVTTYICENRTVEAIEPCCYWYKPKFSKTGTEEPQVVTVPNDLVVEEYAITYINDKGKDASGFLKVGFYGNEVYIQGFCTSLSEAWMKGTLEGTTITFAGNQYFGEYYHYPYHYNFFLQKEGVVFTYDAEVGKMSATGTITIHSGDDVASDIYVNPVITKITEKVATPATPAITEITISAGTPVIYYTVPTTDTEGNTMLSGKLAFRFFTDVQQEITLLTFTPADYIHLKEDMTVIPYGFNDHYDILPRYIFLHQAGYNTWNKIGIQSIYTGGGEEKTSDISWFTIRDYDYVPPTPVEAPANLATNTYILKASALSGYGEEVTDNYCISVMVGFDGDDAYFQGLAADAPELWVKATKNSSGQYVIPANQFMGTTNLYGIYFYNYFITAVDDEGNMMDAVLDFDAWNLQFSTAQTLALNGSQTEVRPFMTYTNVTITDSNSFAGISVTLNDDEQIKDKKVYDLQGQRVTNSQLKKGIYIVNGMKVVVK